MEKEKISLSIDRRTYIMDPRPSTPILPRKQIVSVELSDPQNLQALNPLGLDLHNMFVLLL